MSKVVLINGSPNEHGCTDTALQELEKVLVSEGIEIEHIYLGKGAIRGCTGCGHCRNSEDGLCVVKDEVNHLIEEVNEIDGLVIGSPVYYGSPSGHLMAALDRFFFATEPVLAGKLGASVVSCRRGGATGAFMSLNQYFLNCGMHIVGSEYWNMVHGHTPDDVRQDLEGLQTMRVLGQNMAWLLKCIEAGKKAGIEKPVYEERIFTDFIQ